MELTSPSLRMIFFEVVDRSYLNDGMLVVAEYLGFYMDVDNMYMHQIMPLVSLAVTKRDRRRKGK